jgi:hypothetical protein
VIDDNEMASFHVQAVEGGDSVLAKEGELRIVPGLLSL